MTPRKIFLFGLCVTMLICLVSAVFPGGMKIGEFSLRYPDYRTWFKPDTTEFKDIRTIIALVDTTVKSNNIIKTNPDSLQHKPTDDVVYDAYPFEYPPGQDSLLFPLFRSFNKAYQRNKPSRILHYGDSQIETDRITSTIRNYMQKKFGGQGIGFLPIVPLNEQSVSFQQDIASNWKRFSILSKDKKSNNRFGISGSVSCYFPSNEADTMAHIGLLPIYTGYRSTRTFTHARLFFGQAVRPFTIVVNQSYKQQKMAQNTVSSAWWQFETPQNSLDLMLISSAFPDVYGITLDGKNGVAVDNLPLRGSSGLDFSRMDTAQMGQMFRMMDVEMLIIQFGANVVPNIVNDYDYYSRKLTGELTLLKSLKPGLVIVVVGVNDMSQNSLNGYQSYPNIVKIRDAQKKSAFEAGCVFWDLYEAMGGENSMPGWVFAKPPLAQKDFVHFTIGGARVVAELFCRAWDMEYMKFYTIFGI